jgi:hypothetical protein
MLVLLKLLLLIDNLMQVHIILHKNNNLFMCLLFIKINQKKIIYLFMILISNKVKIKYLELLKCQICQKRIVYNLWKKILLNCKEKKWKFNTFIKKFHMLIGVNKIVRLMKFDIFYFCLNITLRV